MNKIRVMQLGRFDNKQLSGGLQLYVETVMESTKRSVISDNFVASTTSESWTRTEGDNHVYGSASYGLVASVPIAPGLIFSVLKAWRRKRYDLIHLHFPDPLSMVIAWLLPQSVPIVVTWHSDVVKQKFALFAYLPILKLFLRRVSAVIVATPKHIESCSQLKLFRKPDHIHIIPFGVETKRLELTPGQESEVTAVRNKYPGKVLLFALGRHVYYKGYTYLVTAMKKVKGAQLLIGGTGPLTPSLKAQAANEAVADSVAFLGHITDEKLRVFLHASDVFCFPSVDTSEAYGFAQIEAMLCGTPVVCCELNNGVNFVNQEGITGLTVPPRDPDCLAAAIQRLVDDEELRKKLGSQAQTRASREFSLDAMGERLTELYSKYIS